MRIVMATSLQRSFRRVQVCHADHRRCVFDLGSRLSVAFGAKNDWAEGTPGRSTGATRDYYNAAGDLAWKNFMGDWRDADDVAQGATAYATASVEDDDRGKFIEWDVTTLVRQWQEGKHQNQGFFLRHRAAAAARSSSAAANMPRRNIGRD